MKDERNERISKIRELNKQIPEQVEIDARRARQEKDRRTRDALYQEGKELGMMGGNIDEVTGTVELNGKLEEKRTNGSFIGGYNAGREFASMYGEKSHKTR